VETHQVISRRILLVLALAWLPPDTPAALGQTVGAYTGTISGKVTDNTGSVLADVAVTLSSPALMGDSIELTNREGFYRFPALPPGNYALVFALKNFRSARRENIHVAPGFNATVSVELGEVTLQETLNVGRASPAIDAQSTAVSTTFDAEQLASLPGVRSMSAILAATPAVLMTRFDVGGNNTVTGSQVGAFGTLGWNRPTVEGIIVVGITGSGFGLDVGSFDEVSAGTAAHGPEWPAPGVQMQFVSKSGGNKYHGTVYGDYENRDWQSINIDERQIRAGAQGGLGVAARETNRLSSYYDFNADVGGFIKPDALWWYASFRDESLSARQVNFPVSPVRTWLTDYTGKGTYQATPNNRLVAFGQAGRTYQPYRIVPFGPAGSVIGPATAVTLSAESTSRQLAWGWIWKGEWNAVVNDHVFFEVRAGQFGSNRDDRPNGAAPRFEDVSNLVVHGGGRDFRQELRRNQLLGSVSYFKDHALGDHHFKIGGELVDTSSTEFWRHGYPGDLVHVLKNDSPVEVYLLQTPSRSVSALRAYAIYGSDSWRLNNRLTLNLGLRFDRYRPFLPEQEHPAGRFNAASQTFAAVDNLIDWNRFAPRVGVVHDLTGDGKTFLKLTYNHYTLGPGTEVSANANPNADLWWQRFEWSDVDGSGVWENGEQGRELDRRGGLAIESLDPDLDLPILREAGAWIEREVLWAIGVRTGIVWRGERQHYMRQNINRPFAAFTLATVIPDPGPDGVAGTGDEGPGIRGADLPHDFDRQTSRNVVRNVPNADSQHWTWDFTASRRFSRRWSLVAGLAHTWSSDQANAYMGQSVRQNMYPLTPNDLINAGPDGRHEFTTWSAKLYGTYEGPWGVRVTPFLRHQSGQPFGRTIAATLSYGTVRVLAEPIGARRMDNVTLLDARVEKGFRIAGRRVAGFVDVFNLLNGNPEQEMVWSSGSSFLRPLNIVAPRIARVGGKLQW